MDGRFRTRSLSGYGSVARPGTVFVAGLVRWRRCPSFFRLGLQIVFPYFRIGLTLDLKRSAKISLSMNLNVRLIIPITWLAFSTVLFMCSLKVNRLSMVTPGSFSAVIFLSSVVWSSLVFIVYVCSRSRCPILMILHLSGCNFSIHFCDHASSVLMSHCRDCRDSRAMSAS